MVNVQRSRVRLLGASCALNAERTEPFAPERRFHLLAYLAFRNCWVSRDQLAGLLWPERPNAAARSNLRYVLRQVKQTPWLAGFEMQGESLRWDVDTDLLDFERASAQRQWQTAVELYGGPLLEGLEQTASAPYLDWLVFERERLAGLWRDAVHARLAELAGDPFACLDLARRALQSDPLDEIALAAAMRAQLEQRDASAGLRSYETFAGRLAEELGVEPSAATRELAHQLRRAVPGSRPVVVAPTASPRSDLVGRRIELAQLTELIAAPECRVLTVTGPGGIGKSRLARAALALLEPQFPDGIWWIELDDLVDEQQVAPRIAARIGLSLAGTADPLDQVVERLRSRQSLLVFDSTEHLPRLGRVLEALLERCRPLKLLLTSRSRMHVAGEWLLPLEGLPVPDEGESETDVLRAFDSVRLFELRARAANPELDLRRQSADVAALVQIVEGMPLAIELAASWLRVLPLPELLDHLRGSLDLLGSVSDEGWRDRSVQASFDRSWSLLTPRERSALAALSVFSGDFSRQAALAVAQAPLPVLASLVDKSLVRADSGRFSLHALIRQCAAAFLSDPAAVRRLHAEFYAQLLARYSDFKRIDLRQALAEIGLELSNAQRAWKFAQEAGTPGLIREMAIPLMHFFEESGRYLEGITLMEQACAALGGSGESARTALATCRRAAGVLRFRRGEFDTAIALTQLALQTCEAASDRKGVKSCLNLLGLCYWQLSRHEEARDCYLRALNLARQDDDLEGVGSFSGNLALIERVQGRYETAHQLLGEAIDVDRRLGNTRGLVAKLNNLGNLHRTQRNYPAALRCLEESLHLCDAHGFAASRPHVLVNLGLTHAALGHASDAARFCRQALEEARRHGNRQIEIATLLAIARIEVDRDAPDAARELVREALALATGYPTMNFSAIAAYGHIIAAEGDRVRAALLWQFVADSPLAVVAEREEARVQIEELGLDSSEAAAVREQAIDATSEALAQRLLDELTAMARQPQ